jgi:NAD(P)-dependent dehydrogenase (short-subunit alcohol dehydrogenase family)
MGQLQGKRVLITGALGTIGRAMVDRYAQEGATLIALDRAEASTAQVVLDAITPGVRYLACDLNRLSETESAVSVLLSETGGVDVLVNNAALVIKKPFEAFTHEEYEDQIRVNSTAAFMLARVCSRSMIERKAGKIVNITSMTLTGHWDGFVPYIASKGALYGLVKGLARELGLHGINVNGISPGAVVSEAEFRDWPETREAYHQWILDRQCLKRRIEAVDIANLAVFLSSSLSDLITGQNIQVDGGW